MSHEACDAQGGKGPQHVAFCVADLLSSHKEKKMAEKWCVPFSCEVVACGFEWPGDKRKITSQAIVPMAGYRVCRSVTAILDL